MGNLNVFKVGLWVKGNFPFYILDIKNDEVYPIFADGSGSWRREIWVKDLLNLTHEKQFSAEKALKKAYKRRRFDNLTYIEYLARIKENERLTKSKKSV